ncbi:MAG: TrkA family potassium uptake protein [Spirochaetales bacterium]|nr:TrkA family potassium uptake protein [Spirochaetales bacterium]
MKQFVIIGLGIFGRRMVDELTKFHAEVMIIDQDESLTNQYKDKVSAVYIANAFQEEVIRKLVPDTIDAAIIDLGKQIEVSSLVTNYLKKIGVKNIIARAESNEHGEILQMLGATQVIFPAKEAAQRITPMLVSSDLFNYLPISQGLVMAEIRVPKELQGKTLIESGIRNSFNVNVIAVRKDEEDFEFASGNHRLAPYDILLAVGKEQDLINLSGIQVTGKKRNGLNLFKALFSRRGK